MRRVCLVAAVALITAGCSNTPSASPSVSPTGPPPGASIVAGGCGATPVYKGHEPAWMDEAGAPADLPHVLAGPPTAARLILRYPLRARHPLEPSHKNPLVVDFPPNPSLLPNTRQMSEAQEASIPGYP